MHSGQHSQPPIVLVHGAWGGAWIWRRVLGPLRGPAMKCMPLR